MLRDRFEVANFHRSGRFGFGTRMRTVVNIPVTAVAIVTQADEKKHENKNEKWVFSIGFLLDGFLKICNE